MPRSPLTVTLITLGLACTAHAEADELTDEWVVDAPLVVTADRSFELPNPDPVRRKARNDWLGALASKLGEARSALHEHKVVVTSEAAGTRTFTYDDVAKSLNKAEARLAEAADAESSGQRIDLGLPKKPSRDRDLKVELTGGVDTVGVLLSKKM